ncbi:MAG: hypothetical protein QG608_2757 [Actinomycetota bacterium]|nr:hypothetical protein [Actinomycetota bacterium]
MDGKSQLGLRELTEALSKGESVVAVHYASESFITSKDRPPAISSIAVYDLHSSDVQGFSRADAPPCVEGEDREIDLLKRFYCHLDTLQESRILHWNMNRPEFGFSALETRYRYLTEKNPSCAPLRRLYDIDTLIASQYGENYAPHQKLESVARLNSLDLRSFMSGKNEAAEFDKQNWSGIARSSASKAKIIGELLKLLVSGRIRTMDTAGSLQFAGSRLDAVATVLEIGEKFLLVQRRLSREHRGRTGLSFDDEWDDQFLFEALLTQFFDDVRPEDPASSQSGASSRVDFLLPDFKLGVELKHTRESMSAKDLGAQILIDRDRYKAHASINHLVVLVFDYEGRLTNPRGLEKDLRQEHARSDLTVTVRIYDR